MAGVPSYHLVTDSPHKLPEGHLFWLFEAVDDVIPIDLSSIVVQDSEEVKPHALHEGVP